MQYPSIVPCYEVFELVLQGPSSGNSFTDVEVSARFEKDDRIINVAGFYDGEGIYRIRFMPDELGEWRFKVKSNWPSLNDWEGSFTCSTALPETHGPVRVANQYHFAYADGTFYLPIGTTCYAWTHQGDELEQQTLESLRQSPFNKIRMCVFPKHYRYNANEPPLYPFEKTVNGGWDFTRLTPAYFRHFEKRVAELGKLGIEADVILFHPYDRWGFADMGQEADERYLHYVIARLAAYHNVWWSLANEYDLLRHKTMADWDNLFQFIQQNDPYNHLRSVHNWQGLDTHGCETFYDHRKSWVTHCSIQHGYVDLVTNWREQFGKPVVVDECCYEGNLPNGWGNISGQEMVRRFWESTVRGGYAGHGETFLDPDEIIWWSKGGTLHGESPSRIAFLKQVLESLSPGGFSPLGRITDTNLSSAGQPGHFYLTYFGVRQPGQMTITIKEAGRYSAEIIDTWEMTTQPVLGSFEKTVTLELPSRPYLAVLIRRLD
jgi:hypothetical protein